jgi:hypothetical protein
MTDINDDNWTTILDIVDALFARLADSLINRTGASPLDTHERLWIAFDRGYFRLTSDADDNLRVEPCLSADQRRLAVEQNKPLADYRRRVIEAAVRQVADWQSARR